MKVIIYSNAPTVNSGYGVQCAHLVTRLTREGHEVAVACNYGQQGRVGTFDTPYGPVKLYPASENVGNSIEAIVPHALDFFGGDPLGGWIISLIDQFILQPIASDLASMNVMLWTPVDHWPCPPDVARVIKSSDALALGMSKYATFELGRLGIDAVTVPLSVDTAVYRPVDPEPVRRAYGFGPDTFVALMVAMNKSPEDRKGFNEAFRGFALFHEQNPDSALIVHSDRTGAMGSGINLAKLAKHAGIPDHAIIFTDPYRRLLGVTPENMAYLFSAADVLLCPSRGEGFGVPMIEAQACGTPVIASDFSAQTELVGPGWLVKGQLGFDPHQDASWFNADIGEIAAALTECHQSDRVALSEACRAFALRYDADVIFDAVWRPLLASLEPAKRSGLPKMKRVDVLVPFVRDGNRERLESSFAATAPAGKARLLEGVKGKSYAENVNALLAESTADWVLVVGDDVEFTPGWFAAARELSDQFDIIGTNDSEAGRIRNPEVAAGKHADHFFVRRSYVDDEGASLDGPGILAPECYRHWWTDKEIIGLAKARGVYGHAADCRIIHHHPGYDGNEAARAGDLVYMMAVGASADDAETFQQRAPLILEHKTWRGRM